MGKSKYEFRFSDTDEEVGIPLISKYPIAFDIATELANKEGREITLSENGEDAEYIVPDGHPTYGEY